MAIMQKFLKEFWSGVNKFMPEEKERQKRPK